MPTDRRQMTARVLSLQSSEAAVPPSAQTPAERLGQLGQLSEYQWRLTGGSLPSYTRATIPAAVLRPRPRD